MRMKSLKLTSYLPSPLTTLSLFFSFASSFANEFEPYTLNGGLVSAVAGKDFIVVASDTRLSNGYEILTRTHLQSRLWIASGGDLLINSSLLAEDGSIIIPTDERSSCDTPFNAANNEISTPPSFVARPPTFIASAGCATDCEALKRQIRSEIDSHVHWNHGMQTLSPSGVATLLGQTLYSRRGFPFYSFCIVAGLDTVGGVVHVYDAIGSHEKVAVACAGTGKEMLQPILDRMFASVSTHMLERGVMEGNDKIYEEDGLPKLVRDGRSVHSTKQRIGLKLQPPVATYVECSAEEAVTLLVRGYRSVAEREIAVGDDVVICMIKRNRERNSSHKNIDALDDPCSIEVFNYPLKKH